MLNGRPRFDAADLLVAVDQEDGGQRRFLAQFLQGAQGEEALHQPGLHVIAARPAQHVPVDNQRHLGQCADRPDGVAVAEQELAGAAVRVGRAGDQIAAGARARRVGHVVAKRRELRRQDGLWAGLRRRRVGRRLGGDEGGE